MSETRTATAPATALAARPAGGRTLRRTLAASVLAVAATAGVGAIGTGTASAAGPAYLPYYGSSTTFPSWVWGSTAVCARNETTTRTASVKVQVGSGSAQYMYVRPGDSACIYPWGYGATIYVTNASSTPVTAWTH